MTNLLKETIQQMKSINKTARDIEFIGSNDGTHSCSCVEFIKLADREYDAGYGGEEVAVDLVIVFKDKSWLARETYDGSEWWAYFKTPIKALETKSIEKLIFDSYGYVQIGENL